LINLDISRYSNLIIALILNIYKNNKVITILFANKIDEIDKEFKLNLKKIYLIYCLSLVTKYLRQKQQNSKEKRRLLKVLLLI